jgi:hypothetical protein
MSCHLLRFRLGRRRRNTTGQMLPELEIASRGWLATALDNQAGGDIVQKVDVLVKQTLYDLASLRIMYDCYFTWIPGRSCWRLSGGAGRNRWFTDWFFCSCQAAAIVAANRYLSEFGLRARRDQRHWAADSQRNLL